MSTEMTAAVLQIAETSTETARKEIARQATASLPRGTRQDAQAVLLAEAKRVEGLRRARAKASKCPKVLSLTDRIRDRILREARVEIDRRGLQGATWAYPDTVADRQGWLALLVAEGWYEYSKSYGTYFKRVGWLYGRDDNGPWVVRVPQTIETVAEALEWITPAAVRRAEAEGRWVARQGDAYLVELRAGRNNLDALRWTRHTYDASTHTMRHPEHAPLVVPETVRVVRAYAQSVVGSQGRGYAAD